MLWVKYDPGTLFECTLLQEHGYYMLLEEQILKYSSRLSTMAQEYMVLDHGHFSAHCSRSMLVICSWRSKSWNILPDYHWPRSIWSWTMDLDHKSRSKSQKSSKNEFDITMHFISGRIEKHTMFWVRQEICAQVKWDAEQTFAWIEVMLMSSPFSKWTNVYLRFIFHKSRMNWPVYDRKRPQIFKSRKYF